MRKKRWVAWVTGSLVTLAIVGLVFYGNLLRPRRATFSLKVFCTTLPADDDALSRFLKGHDGWRDVTVTRSGTAVKVQFSADQPPSPATLREVLAECDRLAYGGRTQYRGSFSDHSQQGADWQTFWVEFADLPADDTAITTWLAGQAGVRQPTVRREGKFVVFEFQLASPPPPTILADIVKNCDQLGYGRAAGHISAFGRYQ
jgi:hypothetical protein